MPLGDVLRFQSSMSWIVSMFGDRPTCYSPTIKNISIKSGVHAEPPGQDGIVCPLLASLFQEVRKHNAVLYNHTRGLSKHLT